MFFDAVFHAVTFAFNDRKIGMMKEAVEESGGKGGIVIKDGGPLFKRLVGGQKRGAIFIALAKDLEKEIGALFINGQITEFVNDQQAGFAET